MKKEKNKSQEILEICSQPVSVEAVADFSFFALFLSEVVRLSFLLFFSFIMSPSSGSCSCVAWLSSSWLSKMIHSCIRVRITCIRRRIAKDVCIQVRIIGIRVRITSRGRIAEVVLGCSRHYIDPIFLILFTANG